MSMRDNRKKIERELAQEELRKAHRQSNIQQEAMEKEAEEAKARVAQEAMEREAQKVKVMEAKERIYEVVGFLHRWAVEPKIAHGLIMGDITMALLVEKAKEFVDTVIAVKKEANIR